MPVAFANHIEIQAHIIDVLNANPEGQFSPFIDQTESSDKRRSDDAITSARRVAAHRIIEAIASNPSHPYWGELKTDVAVAYGDPIPACYGQIGIPLIVPFVGATARTGVPRDPDDVESARENTVGYLTDFFGEEALDIQQHNEAENGFVAPMSCWYSTANGVFKYTGNSAVIPMVRSALTEADYRDIADNKIPVPLVAANVRLAVAILMKEGDNLSQLAGVYAQQGEADLVKIQGGALEVAPINVARAIQNAQRYG